MANLPQHAKGDEDAVVKPDAVLTAAAETGQDLSSVHSPSALAFLANNSNQPRFRTSEIVCDRRNSSGVLPQ